MKRLRYFILIAVELFVGSLLMISLWDSLLYVPIAVSAIVAGLLIWQLVRYFKTNDHATKIKVLRNIVWVLFIPIAVFALTYLVVAIAFVIGFT